MIKSAEKLKIKKEKKTKRIEESGNFKKKMKKMKKNVSRKKKIAGKRNNYS
jgi:hypothetical protein